MFSLSNKICHLKEDKHFNMGFDKHCAPTKPSELSVVIARKMFQSCREEESFQTCTPVGGTRPEDSI